MRKALIILAALFLTPFLAAQTWYTVTTNNQSNRDLGHDARRAVMEGKATQLERIEAATPTIEKGKKRRI
jgi:hypothetical protein